MFGGQLGTGDHGHLMIKHVSMLLRNCLYSKEYSNQGHETPHSLQKQLFSRATSHDRHWYTSSRRFNLSFLQFTNVELMFARSGVSRYVIS